jgi:hypothetical protein
MALLLWLYRTGCRYDSGLVVILSASRVNWRCYRVFGHRGNVLLCLLAVIQMITWILHRLIVAAGLVAIVAPFILWPYIASAVFLGLVLFILVSLLLNDIASIIWRD